MKKEEWRPVVGWRGYYEASSLGRIKSVKRTIHAVKLGKRIKIRLLERVLKSSPNSRGYHLVDLHRNGERLSASIHALVANAFIGKTDGRKIQVNHKNGIKSDNRAENLELCTQQENMKHAFALGLNRARKRRVRCIETGTVFDSILSATKFFGAHSGSITKVARGRLKKTAGHSFVYA